MKHIHYFVFALILYSCSPKQGNGNRVFNEKSKVQIDSSSMAKYNDAISIVQSSGYSNKDSLEKAIKLLEEATSLSPEFAGAYATIAHFYVAGGKVSEGICYMKKACGIKPEDGTMLCGLAQYYDVMQNQDSAQWYYQKALSAYEHQLKEAPDSIPLMVNKHFALSLMKDDGTLFTKFLKEHQKELSATPFWKSFTEHYLEKELDKKEYLETLIHVGKE